jgi:phosphoglycerate kinase
MIDLPKLQNTKLENEIAFLRGDLDVSVVDGQVVEDKRLLCVVETLKYLRANGARKIVLAGHRGRPEGMPSNELSMFPLVEPLKQLTGLDVDFFYGILGQETTDKVQSTESAHIILLENLRFDTREEANDEGFAKELANLADAYVNEAFASSHRTHASIVGVPEEMKRQGKKVFAGLQFAKEVDQLSQLLSNPQRPLISVLSGVKEDKLDYLEAFQSFSDKVLVAGRLPDFIEMANGKWQIANSENVLLAKLMPDKEDITLNSIELFEKEIAKAATVLVAGPIGKYEEEGHRQGTQRVFEAVAQSSVYKIAGGGDTEDALRVLGLSEKFDWVSVGGGAMLEYLSKGTLPGLEALLH